MLQPKKKSNNPADSYPAKKDKRGNATIGGGEGKIPSGPKTGRVKPTMGTAKNGKSFDLNKDGKTTFKDVLIGRGVLPKTAKSGTKMKKAMNGYGGKAASMVPMKSGGKMKKAGMHKMPNGSMMKNSAMKSGGKMAKCKYGCN